MTSKEIVELLCELVDLKELINRGLILKDINRFQDQLEKDLEVLEILKKYLHLKDKLWHGWSYQAIELDKINDIEATQNKEIETDLKILKQWLDN